MKRSITHQGSIEVEDDMGDWTVAVVRRHFNDGPFQRIYIYSQHI